MAYWIKTDFYHGNLNLCLWSVYREETTHPKMSNGLVSQIRCSRAGTFLKLIVLHMHARRPKILRDGTKTSENLHKV